MARIIPGIALQRPALVQQDALGQERFSMQRTVLVTGADRGLGFALCTGLLDRGWRIFAGQYMPNWPELTALAGQFPESLHIVPLERSERTKTAS